MNDRARRLPYDEARYMRFGVIAMLLVAQAAACQLALDFGEGRLPPASDGADAAADVVADAPQSGDARSDAALGPAVSIRQEKAALLAVDDARLYWVPPSANGISAWTKDGGTVESVTTQSINVGAGLAVTGGRAFFAESVACPKIASVATDAHDVTEFGTYNGNCDGIRSVAAAGTTYVISRDASNLLEIGNIDAPSGAAAVSTAAVSGLAAISASSTWVYVAEPSRVVAYARLANGSATARPIATGISPVGFAVDESRVYWIESTGEVRSGPTIPPATPDQGRLLYKDDSLPTHLALTSTWMIWTNGAKQLRAIDKAGGALHELATAPSAITALAAEGDAAYYATDDGNIWRLPLR